MFNVRNRLNQSLTIGEDTLPAGGSRSYAEMNADLKRLEAKGHIRITRSDSEPSNAAKRAEAKTVAEKAAPVPVPVMAPPVEAAKAEEKK